MGLLGFAALTVLGARVLDIENNSFCATPFIAISLIVVLQVLALGIGIQIISLSCRTVIFGNRSLKYENIILHRNDKPKKQEVWKSFFPIEKILVFIFLQILPTPVLPFFIKWSRNCDIPNFLTWELFVVPFLAFILIVLFFAVSYFLVATTVIRSSLYDPDITFVLFPSALFSVLSHTETALFLYATTGEFESLKKLLNPFESMPDSKLSNI